MALTTGTIHQLRAFPALLPDGVYVSSFGTSTPQSLVSLPDLHKPGRIARLRRLRTPADTGVTLTVTADAYTSPVIDTAAAMAASAPAGLVNDPWEVTAASKLIAAARNGSGAAVADWWATWLIEIDQPNAALQQQYPAVYPALSAEQAAAAQAEHLDDPAVRSLAPRPLQWIIDNEYRSQLRRSVMVGKTISLAAGGNPTTYVQAARQSPDEMLVLAGIVTSTGTGSDQLTLTIDLDEGSFTYDVLAYPLGQVGFVPLFLQAERLIQVRAATQTAEQISVAANIWHVGLTDAIRYALGNSVPTDITQPKVAGTL